jgi:broad specificity polyphosphatase/5'/3'-nucleotidase SurE
LEARANRTYSIKLGWNSDTTSNIASHTDRTTKCWYQSSLASWTTSNTSINIPYIQRSSIYKVRCLRRHSHLRNIASNKRNYSCGS